MRALLPIALLLGVSACFTSFAAAQEKKMDLNELLARHAAYSRKPDAPQLKSRTLEGDVQLTMIVGGAGTLAGKAEFASQGERRRFDMKFGHTSYDREHIVTDGDKIAVGFVNSSRRSDLGQFLLAQDQIFREGVFGGVLSSAWPLTAADAKKLKANYEGLKKVDGRELHVVRYRTQRKGGDVEITLYFDPQTYSHVRSTYVQTIRAGIVSTPGATESNVSVPAGPAAVATGETMSARQQVHRIRLEEDFDDFRNSDGYAIPAKWKIKMTTETQQSRVWEWVVNITKVKNNQPVEDGEFVAR